MWCWWLSHTRNFPWSLELSAVSNKCNEVRHVTSIYDALFCGPDFLSFATGLECRFCALPDEQALTRSEPNSSCIIGRQLSTPQLWPDLPQSCGTEVRGGELGVKGTKGIFLAYYPLANTKRVGRQPAEKVKDTTIDGCPICAK